MNLPNLFAASKAMGTHKDDLSPIGGIVQLTQQGFKWTNAFILIDCSWDDWSGFQSAKIEQDMFISIADWNRIHKAATTARNSIRLLQTDAGLDVEVCSSKSGVSTLHIQPLEWRKYPDFDSVTPSDENKKSIDGITLASNLLLGISQMLPDATFQFSFFGTDRAMKVKAFSRSEDNVTQINNLLAMPAKMLES